MKDTLNINDTLSTLNDVLVRERVAIILMDLEKLQMIQQEKADLLAEVHPLPAGGSIAQEALLSEIQANNDRNQHLLRASLRLFTGMRQRLLQRLSPTYSRAGERMGPVPGARMLQGSI